MPLARVLSALVCHVMNPAGTRAEHFSELFDETRAESSLSERRSRLPWEVFAQLMRLGLRTLAVATAQPDAFWRGWRLVALDGTQFSLTNTPQVKAAARKARSRRGRAGQSEWAQALEWVAQRLALALLLADRRHGGAAFVAVAGDACAAVGSHFLIRARTNIQVQTGRRWKDGSRLVRVPVRQQGQPRVILRWLELREIRGRVQRPGQRAQALRPWTSLLDPDAALALELLELYAQRWEHELYYREVKRALRKNEVLQSHTVETGAQEIAAMVLASALLARARGRAAAGEGPVLRVSFLKTLHLLRPLWLTLALGDDLLSARQKQQLTERFLTRAGRYVTRRRPRPRSCPRAVRRNQSWEGPVQFKLL